MNLYPFGKTLACAYVNLIYNVKYEGQENIPQNQGFIITSNHQTFYDPILIAHKVKPQLRFMAKAEFFANKLVGWLFKSLGVFPVQRGKSDRTSLDTAKKIIQDGGVMAIFLEGTRSKDGNPGSPKPGVAMIAGAVGCGVQPVAISFKGKLSFRKKVTVRYGKFIPLEQLGIEAGASSTVRKASHLIMNAIVDSMDRDCFDYEAYINKRLGAGEKNNAGNNS